MIELLKNFCVHTPAWVFPLLTYLLYIGIKATRTRIVLIPRMFIMPAIFTLLKFKSINGYFLFFLIISMIISFYAHKNISFSKTKERLQVEVPGSYSNLVTLAIFFPAKYFFGYLSFVNPSLYATLLPIDSIISAVLSGYLAGKALRLLHAYQKRSYEKSTI
ncbi:hypothetical protein K0U07_01725 [bacterium]|nr:hypothetical protein [bacterium]